jgi:hypothetical protein
MKEGMSVFDIGKAYLFSAVSGAITYQGKPVTATKVIRKYDLNKVIAEHTITNDNGEFHFNAIRRHSISQLLPIEFVVGQKIVVFHEGEEIEIWSNSKRSTAKNSELGGQPLNLTCELSDSDCLHKEFGGILVTKCKW